MTIILNKNTITNMLPEAIYQYFFSIMSLVLFPVPILLLIILVKHILTKK